MQLEDLLQRRELVSLVREELDDEPWYGFVVGAGSEFVVLHSVSDRYDLDGYRVFMRCDLTQVDPEFARRGVIESAFRLKNISPEAPAAPLNLTSIRTLIESIQEAYPLVVIDRERLYPDECEIGRVRIDSDQSYSLLGITPEAKWELDNRVFRYSDITQISFGGEYEQTLAMVAEPPPRGAAFYG